MGGSLPEMGEWDAVFDETYLRTYLPVLTEERTREEALGAVALTGLAPGADVLDCPVGFGRHAILLADAGYHVTGLDRSETQLAEAERRRGEREWPRLVRGDYRELPFADATFDAALNLFSSLGYLERADDVGVLREFRRVLRPGGTLVIETAHRDALARSATAHTFNRLPDGSIFLHEHEVDWVEGTVSTLHTIVGPGGERIERRFVHRIYTAKEWAAMLREAGFETIDAFGDWGESPPGPEATRLILRAR